MVKDEKLFNIRVDKSSKAPIESFDFGEVEAGIKTKKVFWLENITGGFITELSFSISDESVKIIKAPTGFNPDEEKDFILEVKAPVTIKKGLKVPIDIKAKVTYVP